MLELGGYVMNQKNKYCEPHQTIVTIICLQVHKQQCNMLIIWNDGQISISISNTTTWNKPWNPKIINVFYPFKVDNYKDFI